MPFQFGGEKALVTGAGKGIGYGIAKALWNAGAHVYALSRTQSDLEVLQKECPGIISICVDLENLNVVKDKLSILPDDVTLLVNNAGFSQLHHFLDITEASFDKIFNINVKSLLFVSQIIAKKMVANGNGGKIVNMSSQASLVALPKHTSYCASKGAVDQLTRCMALELGEHKIRVNAINPTVVLTDMGKLAWSDPATGDPMKNQIPLGTFAEVEDVVNATLYLLSNESNMINGVVLPLDGGFLATRTMK